MLNTQLLLNWALGAALVYLQRATLSSLANWVHSALQAHVTPTTCVLAVYGAAILYILALLRVLFIRLARMKANGRKKIKGSQVRLYYDEKGNPKGRVIEDIELSLVPRAPPTRDPPVNSMVPSALGSPKGPTRTAPLNDAGTFELVSLHVWDGFPNGRFRSDFTAEHVKLTNELVCYWASDKLRGHKGTRKAKDSRKGLERRYVCAGVITCTSPTCAISIAPSDDISPQLQVLCECGAALHHLRCPIEWSTTIYQAGAIFSNSGIHLHGRYTHTLLPDRRKALKLRELVVKPPIQLQVGAGQSESSSGEEFQFELSNGERDSGDGHATEDMESDGDAHMNAALADSNDEMALDPDADKAV
ncbi:hypothetical protein MIND_00391200 [Mycena indigotica]|uniref:Uncharacterized protein n=1 Tax=Mycena indigotica TaxID=2126181 RepID=A0A8H6T352_9AGAR|nr:uncharacterized protein MIND_00391200 [Mycena indigotica]KAF7310176.1 hypothetical protein MIND_00391200 [Mycena indigotica]